MERLKVWWKEMKPGDLAAFYGAAMLSLDRLTLARLFSVPDDARALMRVVGANLSRPAPGGGLLGVHALSCQPEDGRPLQVLCGVAHFRERMTFRAADGALPQPGSPEACANDLLDRRQALGHPVRASEADQAALYAQVFETAAMAVPHDVDREKLWVRKGELLRAVDSGLRPSGISSGLERERARAVVPRGRDSRRLTVRLTGRGPP